MRHLILTAALAASLGLGGCAPQPFPISSDPPPVSSNAIVAGVLANCHYAVEIGSVVSVMSAQPAWSTVGQFVNAICKAVAPYAPAVFGGRRAARRGIPKVGRVPIRGAFVQ